MYCINCGARIPEGTDTCPECGTTLKAVAVPAAEQSEEIVSQPQYPVSVQPQRTHQPRAVAADPERESAANSTLVFGILGLAFADTFFLSFLGIIFSAIGLKKARLYESTYGFLHGKSKVGRILAKVGLILGIVCTVLFVIYVIIYVFIIIFMIAEGNRGSSYYY